MDSEVQVAHEVSLQIVKVPKTMSSALKRAVCDSFVATGVRFDMSEKEIEEWLNVGSTLLWQ